MQRFGPLKLEQGKRDFPFPDHQLHDPYADEPQLTILNRRISGRFSRAMVRNSVPGVSSQMFVADMFVGVEMVQKRAHPCSITSSRGSFTKSCTVFAPQY